MSFVGIEQKVINAHTRRDEARQQAEEKFSSSTPREDNRGVVEGSMGREDLTKLVATIVDDVLQ